MALRVFVTGGTFDKEYNELTGQLFFRETHVPEMLRLGRNQAPVQVETLMMVDSVDMSASDRKSVCDRCRAVREDRIVITHGTDTMAETARMLSERVQGKTIVLTGAMVPYKFGSSDGLFNLGSALAFAQVLPPGVYVAMNGRYFTWDNVHKNQDKGLFEESRGE